VLLKNKIEKNQKRLFVKKKELPLHPL